MADVKVSAMTFPYPLGQLKPGGTGAAIALTSHVRPVREDGAVDPLFIIHIRAAPGNSGNIYLCNSTAAPDTTNFTNIFDILDAGQERYIFQSFSGRPDVTTVYIGADNGSDYAVASLEP